MSDIEMNLAGLERVLKALKQTRAKVRVGILGDSDARKLGKGSNATIGQKHEFGLDGMPIRSFLRMPITEKLQEFLDKSKNFDKDTLARVVRTGKLTPWLKKMGQVAEDIVAEAFHTGGFGKWPPWKGNYKSNTGEILVNTQQLRDSITSDVIGVTE